MAFSLWGPVFGSTPQALCSDHWSLPAPHDGPLTERGGEREGQRLRDGERKGEREREKEKMERRENLERAGNERETGRGKMSRGADYEN